MSATVRREGVWEIREWEEYPGIQQKRLMECPLCPYQFSRNEERAGHFFEVHSPEDFGLSPVGDKGALLAVGDSGK